jgi:hypothetical protein
MVRKKINWNKWNYKVEVPTEVSFDPRIPLFKICMQLTREAFNKKSREYRYGFLYIKFTNVPLFEINGLANVPLAATNQQQTNPVGKKDNLRGVYKTFDASESVEIRTGNS